MILDNFLIQNSINGFFKSSIWDFEDIVSVDAMKQLEMTRLIFDDGEECYTTGKTIVIGKSFPVFRDESNNIAYRRVQGVLIHELAHLLYTDFREYSSFINTAPHKFKTSKNIAKNVLNILEDYRIEKKIGERNEFYKKLFLMVRYHIINDLKNHINVNIENDADRLNVLINSLLLIGYIGSPFKTKDKTTNEILVEFVPLVKKATYASSTKEVSEVAGNIMSLLRNLNIEDTDLALSDEIKSLMGKLKQKGSYFASEANTTGANIDILYTGNNEAEEVDQVTDITKMLEKEEQKAKESLSEMGNLIQEEMLKLEREDITDKILNNYLNSDSEIKKEKKLNQEELAIEELKKELPDHHSHKRIHIKKSVNIETYSLDHYELIKKTLILHIKKTISQLNKLIEIKFDDWQYNQKRGVLDTDSLVKFLKFDEMDIFKTQYPEEEKMAMDVMLLVDCSGSNSTKVLNKKNNERLSRYKVNQMISLFLHEILKGIEWKHSIWGFYSGTSENISPIVPFTDCFGKKSGLKIRDIGARSANRDGLHIRMAGRHLAGNADTERKLLIVLSDGHPSAKGYSGESAMKDVFEATQELKELGVKTIGIFSGDESENRYFSKMYENHIFLNNEGIYDFPDEIYKILVKEFESEDV
ncbi:hypothetical protein AAGG74_17350 [Bacillus mexicanus]|uniref:hypothetical protein n=1 Tax=Bacillus mexicanus TaxID=2834415 RepID=UPI003D1C0BD6